MFPPVRWLPLALLGLGDLCACRDGSRTYPCDEAHQCVQRGIQGVCEGTGLCSFSDPTCTSGRRYGEHAGALSGACLEEPGADLGPGLDLGPASPDSGPDLGPTHPPCIASVAAGNFFTCALRAEGSVWCWGANDRGQLGDGTLDARATPRPVTVDQVGTALQGVTQIAVGGRHVCARRNDGSLWCWGNNSQGQLGSGSATTEAPRPTLVETTSAGHPFGGMAVVTGGRSHTCSVGADGSLWCWGLNSASQLGRSQDTLAGSDRPVSIISAGIAVVASGHRASHTCALSAADELLCWGSNSSGQLGNGGTENGRTPQTVAVVSRALQVALGEDFTCARQEAGRVTCWGANEAAQLGVEGGTSPVSPVEDALEVSLGSRHTCVRLPGNALDCWGDNTYGQILGAGPTAHRLAPGAFAAPVRGAALGEAHTCVIRADEEEIDCWGDNTYGQLGDGPPSGSSGIRSTRLGCP